MLSFDSRQIINHPPPLVGASIFKHQGLKLDVSPTSSSIKMPVTPCLRSVMAMYLVLRLHLIQCSVASETKQISAGTQIFVYTGGTWLPWHCCLSLSLNFSLELCDFLQIINYLLDQRHWLYNSVVTTLTYLGNPDLIRHLSLILQHLKCMLQLQGCRLFSVSLYLEKLKKLTLSLVE